MKRLALLLGSLLVVSAAASAKEVVPAPVVVEETPVQVVEKEVIVYRDKEPEWRPSGFIDLQQKYYGRTEGQKTVYNAKTNPDGWNTANDYMRTQLEGRVQMTPNQAIDFRTRHLQSTHLKGGAPSDELRIRYYYDHGTLGDTQIDMMSRLKYEKKGSGRGDQKLEYVLEFDFAKYMFNNDYVKTTRFVVGPSYSYQWSDDMAIDTTGTDGRVAPDKKGESFGYTNNVGIYFNWVTELPFGFGTDLELDTMRYSIGSTDGVFTDANIENGIAYNKAEKREFILPVKFLLTHSWNLYTRDAFSLDWYAEGGYDTYDYSNRDSFSINDEKTSKASYTLYFEPTVTLTYKATDFVSVYGTLGAKYKNWVRTNQTDASHWRWQPYATIGVRTTF